MEQPRFEMASGVELVRIAENRYTLRSEFDAFELSGEAASEFAKQVLLDWDAPRTLDELVSRMPSFSAESVRQQVGLLVSQGLIEEIRSPSVGVAPSLVRFLRSAGLAEAESIERLGSLRIGIFGLEAHGVHLALLLSQLGVGKLRLLDPYPCTAAHEELVSLLGNSSRGRSLQAATASIVAPNRSDIEAGPEIGEIDEAHIEQFVQDCDLVIGCWDQSLSVATHWLNKAAQRFGVPALFGELHATSTWAGPLVLPGRSACWMCYRMRSIACAPDFEQAMAFEEHLEQHRKPRLSTRPLFPFLPEMLAMSLAMETIRFTLGLGAPILIDSVLEHDALTGATESHPLLPVPHCPVCSKKNGSPPPTLAELTSGPPVRTDTLALRSQLVDRKIGIITQFSAVPRDTSEVPLPLVWRAKVANHRFFATYDEERATCSGKGMDLDQVWTSCLGEALERYSASCWSDDVLYQAPRSSLDGRSIDPRDLVLFTDEQYPALPYLPYDDAASISWVRGRSLVDDDLVWVPAIAALMDYPVRDEHEFLFGITSNGLAAGASLQDAILGALCEVLERDAALISWYNRLPGQPYDALTHPDEDIRNLAQLYARRGVELALIRLPTDHPVTVFVGIALQSEGTSGPSAVVGLGADMNPAIAARKAALEVGQVRPSIRRRARSARKQMDDLAANPLTVETMEDHALLYAHPTGGDALRFLFGEPQHWQQPGCASPQYPLSFLIDHFRQIGQEVVYIDLTPPDMRSLGIYTARVIVPGFQPISFGQSERRLGGRRLFEFPVAQGIRSAELSIAELNPLPHPIA